MSTIREASLPGVGRKFQIETANGDRLVVVYHDDETIAVSSFDLKLPPDTRQRCFTNSRHPSIPFLTNNLQRTHCVCRQGRTGAAVQKSLRVVAAKLRPHGGTSGQR